MFEAVNSSGVGIVTDCTLRERRPNVHPGTSVRTLHREQFRNSAVPPHQDAPRRGCQTRSRV